LAQETPDRKSRYSGIISAFGGGMEELVYVLALLISIVALFALLRLFSISNDLKAIREHLCNAKQSGGDASAAKSGSGTLGL
jgi:hypothetical protein